MRAEVAEIESRDRVFQASSCAACGEALYPPTVHFHCMHSFHAACLGEGEANQQQCLACAPQRKRVSEHQQQQRQLARGHDDFFKQLEASSDGFGTISEYLGRGMLCNLSPPP